MWKHGTEAGGDETGRRLRSVRMRSRSHGASALPPKERMLTVRMPPLASEARATPLRYRGAGPPIQVTVKHEGHRPDHDLHRVGRVVADGQGARWLRFDQDADRSPRRQLRHVRPWPTCLPAKSPARCPASRPAGPTPASGTIVMSLRRLAAPAERPDDLPGLYIPQRQARICSYPLSRFVPL